MNHHHRKTLHALFAHPLSANVDFKKVVHLLEDLGAEVDNKPAIGGVENLKSISMNCLTENNALPPNIGRWITAVHPQRT